MKNDFRLLLKKLVNRHFSVKKNKIDLVLRKKKYFLILDKKYFLEVLKKYKNISNYLLIISNFIFNLLIAIYFVSNLFSLILSLKFDLV